MEEHVRSLNGETVSARGTGRDRRKHYGSWDLTQPLLLK